MHHRVIIGDCFGAALAPWYRLSEGTVHPVEVYRDRRIRDSIDLMRFGLRLAQGIVGPGSSTVAILHTGAMPKTIRTRVIIILIAVAWVIWVGWRLVSIRVNIAVLGCALEPVEIIVIHIEGAVSGVNLRGDIAKYIIAITPVAQVRVDHLDLASEAIIEDCRRVAFRIGYIGEKVTRIVGIICGGI